VIPGCRGLALGGTAGTWNGRAFLDPPDGRWLGATSHDERQHANHPRTRCGRAIPGRPDRDPRHHPDQLLHDPARQLGDLHRPAEYPLRPGPEPHRALVGAGRLHPRLRRSAAPRCARR
jgi:hypothetical protein